MPSILVFYSTEHYTWSRVYGKNINFLPVFIGLHVPMDLLKFLLQRFFHFSGYLRTVGLLASLSLMAENPFKSFIQCFQKFAGRYHLIQLWLFSHCGKSGKMKLKALIFGYKSLPRIITCVFFNFLYSHSF